MGSHEMDAAIQECNLIIIVVNDILSLKKEIVSNFYVWLFRSHPFPINI